MVELAAQLDVSDMTVRRDLDVLHDAGLIVKVHGGATVRYEHSTDEPGFEAKFSQNLAEKRAIAASAAVLTGSGAAVGLTAGTTTVQLAAELVSVPNLTVVTNCIRVADVFHAAHRPDRTVILIGESAPPRRPRRAGRCQRAAHVPPRLGVHGRARHPRAGRLHHPQPQGGRYQPRLRRRHRRVDRARRPHQMGRHRPDHHCRARRGNGVVSDDSLSEHARAILTERRRVLVADPCRPPTTSRREAPSGHRHVRAATRVYQAGHRPAVDALDLEIADGEFLVLVGPSGCGKSTTLRMLAGLEPIDEAPCSSATAKSPTLPPRDRDIAMVFQSYALYPHMTVAENIGFHLKIKKVPKAEIDRRVREAAAICSISTDYLDRKPAKLSGGQRQRVAMGRAIVRQPQVFLMDEPLSNLDAKLRVQTRTQIASLQRRLGVTTVYVTHDQVEAMTMGDRVAVLQATACSSSAHHPESCSPCPSMCSSPASSAHRR